MTHSRLHLLQIKASRKIHTVSVSTDMEADGVVDFVATDPQPRPRPPRLPIEGGTILCLLLDSRLAATGGSIPRTSSSSSMTSSSSGWDGASRRAACGDGRPERSCVPTCGKELRAVRCGRARAACGGSSGSGVGRGKGKDRDYDYGGSGVDCLRVAAGGVLYC